MSISIPQSAGIDISKDWLDVHLHPDGSYQRFANEAAGHKALFKWLGGWSIERIAYEATGAYHRAFEQAGRALPLVKLNPRRARRFGQRPKFILSEVEGLKRPERWPKLIVSMPPCWREWQPCSSLTCGPSKVRLWPSFPSSSWRAKVL